MVKSYLRHLAQFQVKFGNVLVPSKCYDRIYNACGTHTENFARKILGFTVLTSLKIRITLLRFTRFYHAADLALDGLSRCSIRCQCFEVIVNSMGKALLLSAEEDLQKS